MNMRHPARVFLVVALALNVVSAPAANWAAQALVDAKLDRTSIPYDGKSPNKMVCDTTLRQLPDGSWALFILAGDDFERKLYIIRKRIERETKDLYVCSLSSRTLIYKGMLTATQIDGIDRKSTRLTPVTSLSRMPSSA